MSFAVLLYGGIHHVGTLGLVLAAGAVLLVFARAAWTFQENRMLLGASRSEALTDALTGLGNRRAMSVALDQLLAEGPSAPPSVLAVFDLNGFKMYNDRFGHIAGDSLLSHLGLRLRDASEERLDELRRAAQLHDIGKAAIPDAILNKTGLLDPQEWAFIERHTLMGERILAAAPSLARVAVIVRSSHENWDGSGYPDRIAGERIPLGARIVRVCDAFDAMTSTRAYARAVSAELALAELERGADVEFDPAADARHEQPGCWSRPRLRTNRARGPRRR